MEHQPEPDLPAATVVLARPGRVRRSRPADRVLEEAFELHHADLCAFAVTLLRDRDAADDVVGEAFAALQREMAADRTPKELRGWLHSVVASTPTTIGSIS